MHEATSSCGDFECVRDRFESAKENEVCRSAADIGCIAWRH
jgi:hypothetical protein